MSESVKIKVDMWEEVEDRFTGALDQKYTKNRQECGFRLNARRFCVRHRAVSRHSVMSNSAVLVTVVVHRFRTLEHHSEEKIDHIHFWELFCGVDVYEATRKEI
jgi:hypothetical protein